MSGALGDRLLRLEDVQTRVGLRRSAIYKLIQEGRFPRPYKPTSYASRWSEREIYEWIEEQKCSDPKGMRTHRKL